MIKVLIVEDSRVVQEFLAHILSSDPAIRVVGFANDGAEALAAVQRKRPDVITMDIHMPKVDGFEATLAIMETVPTPIVIVSGSASAKEVSSTFRAMEAGALAVVFRPPGIGHPEHEARSRELIRTVKLMSEVKVVRRFPRAAKARMAVSLAATGIQIVAIGASTGGPVVIKNILSGLPRDLAVSVLIVQHMAAGFADGFVEWLAGTSRFPLHIPGHREQIMTGHGYVAPDGYHMGVEGGPRIVLSNRATENGLRPSVAYLFRSVAQVLGPRAVGVLLTGMGKDGAAELKLMRDKGAITIAQDRESSIVHGMPGEAIALGGAAHVLPAEKIADALITLVTRRYGK